MAWGTVSSTTCAKICLGGKAWLSGEADLFSGDEWGTSNLMTLSCAYSQGGASGLFWAHRAQPRE
jgi:hypothetical protein